MSIMGHVLPTLIHRYQASLLALDEVASKQTAQNVSI